jgi:hypothetical protein
MNTEEIKGLSVEIYRPAGTVKTPNTLNMFWNFKTLTLVGNGVDEVITAGISTPPVQLLLNNDRTGRPYLYAEPLEPGSYAMGGNYICSSDSRFREISDYPIPLHDRQMNLENAKSVVLPFSGYTHINNHERRFLIQSQGFGNTIDIFCNLDEIPELIHICLHQDQDFKIFEWWNRRWKACSHKHLNELFKAHQIKYKIISK